MLVWSCGEHGRAPIWMVLPPLKPCCQGSIMGFVGGGVNIASETPIPQSSCVLYCKHQTVYGFSLSYFLCLPEALISRCGV